MSSSIWMSGTFATNAEAEKADQKCSKDLPEQMSRAISREVRCYAVLERSP